MDQQTITSLLVKSQNNDTNAFRKIVETHQSFVFAVAFRLVSDTYEAEEITQETFIRVWKNLNRFNLQMRFTTWLYKIVVNLCYDKLKMQKRYRNHIDLNIENSMVLNASSLENIEQDVINAELSAIIRYFTHELTPKQKLVFTLSELEELSTDEIVEITGLTPNKIKSNLYCAKQFIKEKLKMVDVRRGRYER